MISLLLAWAQNQQIKNVLLFPDGNCEFTEKMGMATDTSTVGFGDRSWRYSMLVKNKVIEKIFAEAVNDGDPFKFSDAETMLKYINKDVKIPQSTVLFTKSGCSFCAQAKELLSKKGYPYEEVVCGLGGNVSFEVLQAVSGKTSSPQVFVGGKFIGGFEELEKFLA